MRDSGPILVAILSLGGLCGLLSLFGQNKPKPKGDRTEADLLALIAAQNDLLLRRTLTSTMPAPKPPAPPEPPAVKMLTAEEGFGEWATHCVIKEVNAKGFFTQEAYNPYSLFCEARNADRLHIQTFGGLMKEYVEGIGGRVGKVGTTRFYDVRIAPYPGMGQPLLRGANDI